MQAIPHTQHNHMPVKKVKSENLNAQHRRDAAVAQKLLMAIEAWECTLTEEQRQATITSLVAAKWQEQGGRGITITKLNLYRYLRNPDFSARYTRYALALQPAIIAALPLEIARKFGWRLDEKTGAELAVNSMKECTEFHQVSILGAPVSEIVKEGREAVESIMKLIPMESWGQVLGGFITMMPGGL